MGTLARSCTDSPTAVVDAHQLERALQEFCHHSDIPYLGSIHGPSHKSKPSTSSNAPSPSPTQTIPHHTNTAKLAMAAPFRPVSPSTTASYSPRHSSSTGRPDASACHSPTGLEHTADPDQEQVHRQICGCALS